jgi:hypothetical protein
MLGYSFVTFLLLVSAVRSGSALEQVPQEETISVTADDVISKSCTWDDRFACQDGTKYQDSRLFPMKVPLEIAGTEAETTFVAYVQPDVAEMYNQTIGSMAPLETKFNGVFAKFINLSPHKIHVDWEETPGGNRVFTTALPPFQGGATASFPGHRFIVYDDNTKETLMTWVVQTGNSLYTYDIFDGSLETAAKSLDSRELELYKLQLDNLAFNKVYEEFTGRQWLALYKRKRAPRYPMWPADSFGQTHTVTTRETHLVTLPLSDFALAQTNVYGSTPEERQKLREYRDPNQETLTLNITVLSVIPRVFEVKNFLSPAEVDHIVEVATGMTLSESTTGSNAASRSKASGRTSRNSWIQRSRSVIIDSIHRRAADLLQMDEALFRRRFPNETDLVPETQASIAERLQLVHYDKGQQYTVREAPIGYC